MMRMLKEQEEVNGRAKMMEHCKIREK